MIRTILSHIPVRGNVRKKGNIEPYGQFRTQYKQNVLFYKIVDTTTASCHWFFGQGKGEVASVASY